MNCPNCCSHHIVKNGSLGNGKPKFKCNTCGRQFVENPKKQPISDSTKQLIDKLLLEKIPLAGIARVTGVSERWLQSYVNDKYSQQPQEVNVKKNGGHWMIQIDEIWSFVGNKKNKQWVWLAIDSITGQIVGVFIGDRSQKGAQGLWDSLPLNYRQSAVCYTDFWEAYKTVIPAHRHRPVGKETGRTNKIENFNCLLRQRISRLVRKTLSFSKKIENHIGAIWNFIHHYNSNICNC